MTNATRRLSAVAFVVFAIVALLAAAPRPVIGAAYDRFYANFQGEELMRAMNADRVAVGLRRLAADPGLERIARDRALACPSDSSLVIRGRARDMADRDYLSHEIPGCRDASGNAFDEFDLLRAFGYTWSGAAEVIGEDTYPSSAAAYATGCNAAGGSCGDSITLPSSVAFVERFFMGSAVHRGAILSTAYDHFGCGAWNAANGTHDYACLFTDGANGSTDAMGPAITDVGGSGGTFPLGSTPTFTATASDSQSLLSDGYADLDGAHVRNWADDHTGTSESVSIEAPPLAAGTHRLTWWVRDTSGQTTSRVISFSVAGPPSPTATPARTPGPAATPRPTAGATDRPGATPPPSPAAGTGATSPTPSGAAAAPNPEGPAAASGGSAPYVAATSTSAAAPPPGSALTGAGAASTATAAPSLVAVAGAGADPPTVVVGLAMLAGLVTVAWWFVRGPARSSGRRGSRTPRK